jgi:hypothetical protein
MLLDARIEQYLQVEHLALRHAIAEAHPAIEALRPVRASTTPPPMARRFHPLQNAPTPEAAQTQPKLLPHRAVQESWAALAVPLEAHLGREDRVLAVARRVLGGDIKHRAAMVSVLVQFDAEHAEIRRLAGHLRASAMLLEEARRPVMDVLDRYDDATRVQEIEIYPALLAGSDLAFQLGQTPVPAHYQRSDDVLRSIRASKVDPDARPEPSPTLVQKLMRLIGR